MSAMTNDELADTLAEIREYIERVGWTQGRMIDDQGRVCAVGGICYSQGWHQGVNPFGANWEPYVQIRNAVVAAVKATPEQRWPVGGGDLPDWNDWSTTTEQMVLDAFAKAEKTARAGFDPDE